MNYSFIDDPKLRDALERKRKESNSTKSDPKLNSKINNNNEVLNSSKTKLKKNKKFESLKSKKKQDNKKKLYAQASGHFLMPLIHE